MWKYEDCGLVMRITFLIKNVAYLVDLLLIYRYDLSLILRLLTISVSAQRTQRHILTLNWSKFFSQSKLFYVMNSPPKSLSY